MNRTDELRTARIDSLVTPTELAQRYPVSSSVASHVTDSRRRIEKILNGEDPRLLVVIGPCSIHDLNAAMEYATQLQAQRQKHQARLEIVMRTYFEKPRTVVGWKGLISDPDLNGSYRVNYGLELARRLLLQVNELGVPTATEFLDMVTGQFIADLISWGAIGARTTESQIHREMASALSCPVGFKNGTDGNTRIAVDAIRASRASHMFLSPDKDGQMTIYQTSGNPYGHIIMRGGKNRTTTLKILPPPATRCMNLICRNIWSSTSATATVKNSIAASWTYVMIFASRFVMAPRQLPGLWQRVFAGRHAKIISGQPLIYGQSITDPCLNWEDTEVLLEKLAAAVDSRF